MVVRIDLHYCEVNYADLAQKWMQKISARFGDSVELHLHGAKTAGNLWHPFDIFVNKDPEDFEAGAGSIPPVTKVAAICLGQG